MKKNANGKKDKRKKRCIFKKDAFLNRCVFKKDAKEKKEINGFFSYGEMSMAKKLDVGLG